MHNRQRWELSSSLLLNTWRGRDDELLGHRYTAGTVRKRLEGSGPCSTSSAEFNVYSVFSCAADVAAVVQRVWGVAFELADACQECERDLECAI